MTDNNFTSYALSRKWFDWCFENPEKVSTNHAAIYFFAIEQCNRLGWKKKFGFPTQIAMEAIGIKKYQTYIKYFNELVEWGFFELVQKSINQHTSNIICLISAMPKNGKALDKATITHAAKQTEPMGQSTGQSNSPVYKQQTSKQINNKQQTENLEKEFLELSDIFFERKGIQKKIKLEKVKDLAENFWVNNYLEDHQDQNVNDIRRHFGNWLDKQDIAENTKTMELVVDRLPKQESDNNWIVGENEPNFG